MTLHGPADEVSTRTITPCDHPDAPSTAEMRKRYFVGRNVNTGEVSGIDAVKMEEENFDSAQKAQITMAAKCVGVTREQKLVVFLPSADPRFPLGIINGPHVSLELEGVAGLYLQGSMGTTLQEALDRFVEQVRSVQPVAS